MHKTSRRKNQPAVQALKSSTTHKTDRNDARDLVHLARTGFFKPIHVKPRWRTPSGPGLTFRDHFRYLTVLHETDKGRHTTQPSQFETHRRRLTFDG
jgi:hypothetical protein